MFVLASFIGLQHNIYNLAGRDHILGWIMYAITTLLRYIMQVVNVYM